MKIKYLMETNVTKTHTKYQKTEHKMSEKNELSPRIPRKIHAGQRLEELVNSGKRGTQTALAKHLGVNRGAINDRYKREDLGHNEIVKICEFFQISYEQFVGIDIDTDILERITDQVNESENQYGKKPKYIEERIDNLERVVSEISNQMGKHLKAIKRLTDNQIDEASKS